MTTHYAVVDLGFGDSGKGILTARLARKYKENAVVVKSNGGPQCAHNVIDGPRRLNSGSVSERHHTFGQFGSGTFDDVETIIADTFLVEPTALLREARELSRLSVTDPLDLVHVSEDCLVITPYHWALNQWKEDQRGEGRHGSTGYGINETVTYALQTDLAPRMRDLRDQKGLAGKLKALEQYYCIQTGQEAPFDWNDITREYYEAGKQIHVVDDDEIAFLLEDATIIFESGQGVLLDEDRGFFPHVTRSYTTDVNAREFMGRFLPNDTLHVIGVTRTYTTRHGAGPFITEDPSLADNHPEKHNGEGHYQGEWRVGHLDLVALKYAVDVARPDSLYVTHTDAAPVRACTAYVVGDNTPYQLPLDDDPQNFARRSRHTELLRSGAVKPVYAYKSMHYNQIAEFLGLTLFGIGYGALIEAALFLPHLTATNVMNPFDYNGTLVRGVSNDMNNNIMYQPQDFIVDSSYAPTFFRTLSDPLITNSVKMFKTIQP